MEQFDVVIIGAGAAGLFCAALVGQQGQRVLLIDNGKKAGRKILMSGGGRCNFTNLNITSNAYLSQNPHFCKSALARYTQWDFIELINRYNIAWHEKNLGQLFCNDSAHQVVALLLKECESGRVTLRFNSKIHVVKKNEPGFLIQLNDYKVTTNSLVVASGGLSMPGLGASPFGYKLAEQFGLKLVPTRAALVPLTLDKPLLMYLQTLSGISVPAIVTAENNVSFRENILFTHRGLSGPAILQLSSYCQPGENVNINLLPDINLNTFFNTERLIHPNQSLKNTLAQLLPKRLVECLQALGQLPDLTLKQLNLTQQAALIITLQQWQIRSNGTEGYRTAEVTLGGIDTSELSSKTMESKKIPRLFFIGEVLDVTGWLGGYNFQWAWSSAWACAQALTSYASTYQKGEFNKI